MTSTGEHDMTSPTQKRHDEHHDPLAKVIWDAASRESSMDLPSWESLNGDRRVAHDVARAVREYLRDVEGLVSAVTDQSICDEEIVRTAPTTSPAQRRHEEVVALLTEIRDRLPEPKQPRAQVGIPTSNPVKVTVRREPVDVTEEPPVGSQPACVCGSVDGFDCCADPAPADVDPDEALASDKIIREWRKQRARAEKAEADVERLTQERDEALRRAEIDRLQINRLTRERDTAEGRAATAEREVERLTYLLGSHADGSQCTCEMTDPGVYHGDNMHPPEWEQDPWCPTHPDMNVILTEVKRLRDGIDVIRSEARRESRVAAVPGERRILRAIHLYLSGLLEPKPPADFSTLFNQTEGETDDPA